MKKRKTVTEIAEIKKGYYKRLQRLTGHDLKTIFSQRFKEQKEKTGLSNSQLAEILSVSASTIDKWLGGSSMPRNVEELLKVCALFDRPIRYFTGEIDLTITEITESSGLTGLDSEVLHNLIELAAFLDTFAGHDFNDYYYTVNKLLSSKALLRAVFEYIITSNNQSVYGNAPKKFEAVEIDREFLKRVVLERIKKSLDDIAAKEEVFSELAVIDISSLYDSAEVNAVINLPFPFE